jgi:uncharacterized protein (TIGR02118 family)
VIKLFVFLKRRAGLDEEEFWRHWLERHVPLVRDRDVFRRRARRYVVNRALRVELPELTLSDLDGAAEFWFESLDDLRALVADPTTRDVEADVARFADPERTIFLTCREAVQFDRGFGRVKFVGLSRRAPGFAARDDWIRYWVDVHGPLAHGIPEFTRYYGRYVHNYVLDEDVEYDGIVEEWLESPEAFAACLREPRYLEVVRPDEVRFVDFARSELLLAEEIPVYDVG